MFVLISSFLSFMKGLVKIFDENNQQSEAIFSFLFWNVTTAENKNNSFPRSWLHIMQLLIPNPA